ncbi:ribonuclease HII [Bacillus sp. HMF5848]|uniref:ribonuclease HII n=1 Tax=Bacillus sp. HMF5848 TaxID=2495421 RepID=UPI000F7A7F01|nr:ribonuclease HII [Bacillus sp. HMF5848]RSK27011.1 ribonuclease HII [Bacillus sp. HMF5848]
MEKQSINQIKEIIGDIKDVKDPFIQCLRKDSRKGVQALLLKWEKQLHEEQQAREAFYKKTTYEQEAFAKGVQYIAGVDEVGRGPLAGPVVAAAVILRKDFYLPGLDDSKKLSEQKREQYYDTIVRDAISIGVGIVSADKIDSINIYQAAKLAMKEAVCNLSIKPDYLLVDAMEIPLLIEQQSIIKGDANSISIAAASVVAKVTRDKLMKKLAAQYPQYGFDSHMGYGTAQHLAAIQEYGITSEHRKSFAPVRNAIS